MDCIFGNIEEYQIYFFYQTIFSVMFLHVIDTESVSRKGRLIRFTQIRNENTAKWREKGI